jgi:superfamily II DNA helicase RecQ
MHSYADRYTHDFFFKRDYPDVAILDGIFALLQNQPQEKRELQKQMLMDPEVFDKALEKLWTHGGAVVDFAENVSRGHDAWRQPYLAQGEHKREQIERMIRYAESNQCRMANVVRHFGDLADGEKPCGICDYCAPAQCTAQRFRTATEAEHAALLRVAAELHVGGAKSTGRLYTELFPHHEMSRDDFENLLGGMARAGIVCLDDAVFEKNERQIPYRTARLTLAGAKLDARTPVDLVMKDQEPASTPRRRRKVDKSKIPAYARITSDGSPSGRREKRTNRPSDSKPDAAVEEALRAWRLAEARRLGVPAFRIFTDRALSGLVGLRPGTSSEMLSVPGIGLRIAEKYGHEICRILRG